MPMNYISHAYRSDSKVFAQDPNLNIYFPKQLILRCFLHLPQPLPAEFRDITLK
jgi:hypothetical protein